MTQKFKTFKKDGQYAHLIDKEWYLGLTPRLILPNATMDSIREFNPDINFSGVELVDLLVTETYDGATQR
jgi:hypothetical protein